MLENCPLGEKETHACWECPYGATRINDDGDILSYICGHPQNVTIDFVDESNTGFAVGKINDRDLMSNTLQFDRCERIVFRDKTLDFVFELPETYYKYIDAIIVNGIKFKKTE